MKHDLYRVLVTPTDERGLKVPDANTVRKALVPIGGPEQPSVDATARAVWSEAGSPEHAYIEVFRVGPCLGRFNVRRGEWKQTYSGLKDD